MLLHKGKEDEVLATITPAKPEHKESDVLLCKTKEGRVSGSNK